MIDYNLLEMTDIDSDSKIIIAKVISLNQLEGKCYITNGALCKMLGLKNKATASRKISKLVKIGYLSFYQKSGGKRYLYPTQKLVDAMLTTKLITNDDDFDEMGNPILVNGVSQNESIGYTNLSKEGILNSFNGVSQNQSMITMVKPIVDNGSASIAVTSRQRLNEVVSFSAVTAASSENRVGVRSYGRYHRVRTQPSGDNWSSAIGMDIEIQVAGTR